MCLYEFHLEAGFMDIYIYTLQLLCRILHVFRPALFLTLLVSVKGEVYIWNTFSIASSLVLWYVYSQKKKNFKKHSQVPIQFRLVTFFFFFFFFLNFPFNLYKRECIVGGHLLFCGQYNIEAYYPWRIRRTPDITVFTTLMCSSSKN